jgi:KDO2-lipid IV(A) lauroyltransferase
MMAGAGAGTTESASASSGPTSPPSRSAVRAAAADFWLDSLFRVAGRAPIVTRLTRPLFVRSAFRFSHAIRSATAANARRIFGADASPARVEAYGRGVVASFYDFVCDVGQSLHLTREQLLARIDSVEGHDHYEAARAMRKGAIIATAHMGSFEAGAAAIVDRERAVHVVFKRDETRFEQVRTSLRAKLGVIEAPVDEGWTLWLRLREALLRDEVVMVQADRVMPGQKGSRVPFLHGHLLLPTGPIKLAMASGAPIIPVFAARTPGGKIRIHVEPAVVVDDDPHASLLRLAGVLEKYVRAYPEQWLLFHKAFCDDENENENDGDGDGGKDG